MIKTIIIEDEKPAMDLLIQTLLETDNDVQIDATLSSVKESKAYLSSHQDADVIFSDVQLTDGYSFEIFKSIPTHIPVIFITGYNEFVMNALACNGIDYLLKPVSRKDVYQSLAKYAALKEHFRHQQESLQHFIRTMETRKRSRMIVRKGLEFLALQLSDVVLLYTENKLVYVIDRWGKKYIGDKNLTEMEAELDEQVFFRANRQYIINLHYIKGFKPFEKVKLFVDMEMHDLHHQVIISQENASQFREWIYNA